MAVTWRQLQPAQTARLCVFDLNARKKRVVLEISDAVAEAPNW
jgi:hypothetical protein